MHVPRAAALLRRAPAARRRGRGARGARQGHDRGARGLRHVVVNAAGCGSAMKDYGHVLRDEPGVGRARRGVRRARSATSPRCSPSSSRARRRQPVPMRLAYHDACHLAHAQGVRAQPRELLRAHPGARACGAGRLGDLLRLGRGLQPGEARARRGAGPPQGRSPAGHGRRGGGRGQPGLRASDHRPTAGRLGRSLPVLHPLELLARSIAAAE